MGSGGQAKRCGTGRMTRPRAERPGREPAYVNAPPRLRATDVAAQRGLFRPWPEFDEQPSRWWRK